MFKVKNLHNKVVSSKNRLILKDVYKTKEISSLNLKEIKILVETPSGECWIDNISSPNNFNNDSLYLIKSGKMKEFLLQDLVYLFNNRLYFYKNYRIFYIRHCTEYYNFSTVRKLTINNQFITSLNLNSLDLDYLDLRYNFLTKVIYDKHLFFCDLRNNKIKKNSIKADILFLDKKGGIEKHVSLRKKDILNNFKSEYKKYKIYNIAYRFYIVQRNIHDFEFILTCIIRDIISDNLIEKISEIYNKLKKVCLTKESFYIVCVTEENIIIKTYNVRVIMDYFLQREIIYKEHTYIYDNIGKWYIVPIYENNNKEYYMDSIKIYENNMDSIKIYENNMDSIKIYENNKNNNNLQKTMDKNNNNLHKTLNKDNNNLQKTMNKDNNNLHKLINKDNIEYKKSYNNSVDCIDYTVIIINQHNSHVSDTVLFRKCKITPPKMIIKKYLRNNTSTPKKIDVSFLFIQFFIPKTNEIKYKKKLKFLLKRLQTLDICVILENNGLDCLVYVGQDINRVLKFGLYIFKLFTMYNISLSIGVACGYYWFKSANLNSKFMGNALNKASRLSYLGNGVFCCHCAVFDDDNINFQYIGEKEMKGYTKCVKSYFVYEK